MQFNNRLQPTQIGLGASATNQSLLKIDYEYGELNLGNGQVTAGTNNGNIAKQTITVNNTAAVTGFSATQYYAYDSLNRIKIASENLTPNGGQMYNSWKQTFQYDRYGNRRFDTANNNTTTLPTGCAEAVCNPQINTANNRLTGTTYDNAGNTTIDASGRTFTYDGENKQTKVQNGATVIGEYTYDGDGKRVKKIVPSTGEITIFVYNASGKMVAEYSTIVEPQATAKISYLTNDHLGSPRIITDQNGAIVSRRDFMPFGEEIARTNYGNDKVREKFATYERDGETELDFAQARMYAIKLGRFTTVDPLIDSMETSNPQTFNRYIYVLNSPLIMIDPTGEIGDYYTKGGEWIMNDNIDDDKVYIVTVTTGENGEREIDYDNRRLLPITHTEFLRRAATVFGESSSPDYPFGGDDFQELVAEMAGIAYVHINNKKAYGENNPQAKAFKNTTSSQRNGTNMQVALFAIINSLTGGYDPSKGADGWDGAEQAEYSEDDDRFRDDKKGRELHMNTMGWIISNDLHKKWKANVGSSFKAPQIKVSPGNYKGYKNKGKTRLVAIAVYAKTIFWRELE